MKRSLPMRRRVCGNGSALWRLTNMKGSSERRRTHTTARYSDDSEHMVCKIGIAYPKLIEKRWVLWFGCLLSSLRSLVQSPSELQQAVPLIEAAWEDERIG